MATAKKRLGRGLGSIISGGAKPPAAPSKPVVKKSAAKKAAPSKKKASPSPKKAPKPETPPSPQEPAIPHTPLPAAPKGQTDGPYREIPVDAIVPNPYQPRREIEPERIRELADSIRSEGLLQPIVVRPKDDGYELIAGERRWRACTSLGLKRIPARILEASNASSAVISLIENLQREGLNPIEESLGYASLMRDFDLTQEAVSERLGKARASIANSLRLLSLEREIQAYLAKGTLSTGHAKVLLGVEDSAQRLLLAKRAIEAGWSVRETENQVRRLRAGGRSPKHNEASRNESESEVVRSLEREVSSFLTTPVQLKHSAKKGKLIIEYYGNEDLQRILEKIGLK